MRLQPRTVWQWRDLSHCCPGNDCYFAFEFSAHCDNSVFSSVEPRPSDRFVVQVVEFAFGGGWRLSASSPRSVIQVLDARATSRRCSSKMSHSTRPTILPARTMLASARSFAFHTGRRKLIFNSRVAKLSPSVSVLR